jgi:hypothetical protein
VAAGAPAALYWLANPLFWLGLYLLDRGRIKSVLFVGTIAALLAMLPIMRPDRNLEEIIGSPGNIAWLVSMYLLVIAGYLVPLFPRAPDPIRRNLRAAKHELSAMRSQVRELRALVWFQRDLIGRGEGRGRLNISAFGATSRRRSQGRDE